MDKFSQLEDMKERGREEFSVEQDREMAARKRKRSSSPSRGVMGAANPTSAFHLFYSAKQATIKKHAVEFDGREN